MDLLGTGTQRSGKFSRVGVGAAVLNFSKHDVNETVEDIDTVNFESDGLDEGIAGIQKCDISFGGDWDAAANPLDTLPGIYPRDDLADVKAYINVTDDTFWDFPYMRVRSAQNGSEVRGAVKFSASGMSQGSYSRPTGSV